MINFIKPLFFAILFIYLPILVKAQIPNKKTIKVVRSPQDVLLSKEALKNAKTYYYTNLEEALKEPEKVYKFDLHYEEKILLPIDSSKIREAKDAFSEDYPFTLYYRELEKEKIIHFFKNYAPLFRNLQSICIRYPYRFSYPRMSCEILDIVPYLKEIKYLQELRLENLDQLVIHLEPLFSTLASLTYFDSLDLASSYIYYIPKEILNLKNMKMLLFNAVDFDDEPWIIFQLSSLEELHFCATNLHYIDQSIEKLKKLKKLRVFANGCDYSNMDSQQMIFKTTKEELKQWLPNTTIKYTQPSGPCRDFLEEEED